MPFDRSWTDEELSPDFWVRSPFAGEPGDLRLLSGELVTGGGGAFAHRFAGGHQLATSALGKSFGADVLQHFVGGAKLRAGVDASALAAQPLPVEQMGPCQLDPHPRPGEPLDRLAVQTIGELTRAHQRARTGLDPQCPIRPAGAD